jgi:hypothetical protein
MGFAAISSNTPDPKHQRELLMSLPGIGEATLARLRFPGARLGAAQERLDLGPPLFDGRKVGRVGRQVDHLGPVVLNSLADVRGVMGTQIVQYGQIARAQCWREDLRHTCLKYVGIRRS